MSLPESAKGPWPQGRIDWSDGRFTAVEQKLGGTVDVKDQGRHVSSMPRADWERDGVSMIACWKEGKVFTPRRPFAGKLLSPEQARQAKLEMLEHGTNATRSVEQWVRYLATQEAREGGMYADGIDKVDAEQWPTFAREIFDSLYGEKPQQLETPAVGSEWIGELVNQAEAQSEWSDLREQVKGDPWACGIASGRVVTNLAARAKELLEKLPAQDPQRLQEDAQVTEEMLGKKNRLTKEAKARAEQAAQQAADALAVAQGLGALGAGELEALFADAASEAKEEVADILVSSANMSDLSTGALKSTKAAPETMRKLLADNPNLRKLIELAGRLRIRARKMQRTKTKYAPESIVDVTIGGELERLLPAELVQLVMPETELLLMRKLNEREALQYELEGEERLDRGPVIVAVDSSGSMQGIRNQWAMAVAIAVLEIAAMQKRPFVLMHFDGQVQKRFSVEKPGNLKLEELIEMVSFFSGGGTNFAPPLSEAHALITAGKQKDGVFARADVMLITDGQASWGDWAAKVKATGASLFGVAIDTKFGQSMEAELSGCAYVGGEALNDASANVDLLFGI